MRATDNLFAQWGSAGYNKVSSLGVVPHQLSLDVRLIGAASEKKPFEPDQDNRQRPVCLRRKVMQSAEIRRLV